MMKMMMEMYFHFRIEEPILFREWKPTNVTAYVFSCIAIFLVAFSLELLKFGRSKLRSSKIVQIKNHRQNASCCCSNVDGTWDIPEKRSLTGKPSLAPFTASSIKSKKHVLSSILFFVQNFIDYSLMLVSMTYNYPIFLSLLAGHTFGYFFIGPLTSIEDSEKSGGCCS